MNNDSKVAELAMERAAWAVASDKHREEAITQLVAKYNREGIEQTDPFFIDKMVSNLKRNVSTPDDYKKRRAVN